MIDQQFVVLAEEMAQFEKRMLSEDSEIQKTFLEQNGWYEWHRKTWRNDKRSRSDYSVLSFLEALRCEIRNHIKVQYDKLWQESM